MSPIQNPVGRDDLPRVVNWPMAMSALDPLARRVIEYLLAGMTHAEVCEALCLSRESVTHARECGLAKLCQRVALDRCHEEYHPDRGGALS
jgi:hypothetical protein